jgi:hypothetical protein
MKKHRDKTNARNKARAAGAKTYFTGMPCIHGHISARRTDTGGCIECAAIRSKTDNRVKARSKRYYQENMEKLKEQASLRYYTNPEERARRREKWPETYNKHKKHIAAYLKQYREENKHKIRLWDAKRYNAKIQRVPTWYSQEDDEYYEMLVQLRNIYRDNAGIDLHIDHIVPLQGKNVSGLHWRENWQLLPAKENYSKNNRY